MTPFKHNNIERSASRVWKKKILNEIVKQCEVAGFDVIKESTQIVIGIQETDTIVLKALKGTNGWLTRFDQKLLDENYSE